MFKKNAFKHVFKQSFISNGFLFRFLKQSMVPCQKRGCCYLGTNPNLGHQSQLVFPYYYLQHWSHTRSLFNPQQNGFLPVKRHRFSELHDHRVLDSVQGRLIRFLMSVSRNWCSKEEETLSSWRTEGLTTSLHSHRTLPISSHWCPHDSLYHSLYTITAPPGGLTKTPPLPQWHQSRALPNPHQSWQNSPDKIWIFSWKKIKHTQSELYIYKITHLKNSYGVCYVPE